MKKILWLGIFLSFIFTSHTFAAAVTTPTAQPTLYYSHLSTSQMGNSIKLQGLIDPVKQPNYASYKETLTYSTKSDLSNPIQAAMPSVADTAPGSYYWLIPTAPNTTYYAQQTITLIGANSNVVDPNIVSFDGGTGANLPFNPSAGPGGTAQNLNPHIYTLLAPLPGFSSLPDPLECAVERAAGKAPSICDVNDLLNYFMKLLIGLSGVVLVFRIMYEGFVIMTSDLPFKVASSKSALFTAIWGLLLALSAYLILNTINPQLVAENVGLSQLNIVVNLPDAGDGTVDPAFKTGSGTYSTDATVSPEVTNTVNQIKNGWTLAGFHVYTNDRMAILLTKNGQTDSTNVISISHGINGFAQPGQETQGDRKTPIGSWKILQIRQGSSGQPVYNATGSNMGAAFWLLSPMINGERGIGMHGNKNGTLGGTYGCIRLKNTDILALLPYIQTGMSVVIGN